MKSILDIESIFIILLCTLNTTSQLRKRKLTISAKNIFNDMHKANDSYGLNATSIAEITKIPRTTVLRKILNLQKVGLLKKDKFKRYASDSLYKSEFLQKNLVPIIEENVKSLGIFFSECLRVYTAKH